MKKLIPILKLMVLAAVTVQAADVQMFHAPITDTPDILVGATHRGSTTNYDAATVTPADVVTAGGGIQHLQSSAQVGNKLQIRSFEDFSHLEFVYSDHGGGIWTNLMRLDGSGFHFDAPINGDGSLLTGLQFAGNGLNVDGHGGIFSYLKMSQDTGTNEFLFFGDTTYLRKVVGSNTIPANFDASNGVFHGIVSDANGTIAQQISNAFAPGTNNGAVTLTGTNGHSITITTPGNNPTNMTVVLPSNTGASGVLYWSVNGTNVTCILTNINGGSGYNEAGTMTISGGQTLTHDTGNVLAFNTKIVDTTGTLCDTNNHAFVVAGGTYLFTLKLNLSNNVAGGNLRLIVDDADLPSAGGYNYPAGQLILNITDQRTLTAGQTVKAFIVPAGSNQSLETSQAFYYPTFVITKIAP